MLRGYSGPIDRRLEVNAVQMHLLGPSTMGLARRLSLRLGQERKPLAARLKDRHPSKNVIRQE